MAQFTRRSFAAGAAAGLIGPALMAGGISAAEAQLVWTTSDWKVSEFRQLVAHSARVKQVYDVTRIGDGKFLSNVKNSLNGLHFGFGIPEDQIKVVAALHGPANMINFDDFVWKKYQIGSWLKVMDPATGEPAERNVFYRSAASANAAAAQDPENEHSQLQAKSVQDLQKRGVSFLSCHTATEEQARALVHLRQISASPEVVVRDMLAHTVPGVLVVASMVAALALLQSEGRYTYISA